ncbi:oxygen-independent coproporphyrinogen III oxidase [Sphingobacterium spiritivorum]|uniref:Coproporphyrinogen-III oxidase n=1 Tax=Sphingobacterium spiritivorum ATCC 33861 TaxID=525373 RepID=D7VP65_SPHSI|nr:oxygen-independent coproporphyrinogen III oxidase [Sphingobacterium spiritivorum]EFK57712.1 coproporphyrinogen dehydrogenase [Sphingobacterium spiritivorum ATCC 33861]QQT36252.1 oxygen-independent coproporphyrinogen III oxidase [Sphingobacterium spiritivorum]WQD32990.1 oxygen-independent coproporphyrinogen III oxidase [Sphingobacterium spiritivorum]SUJ18002.1 Oxygen-independent coproporphyrinogen-III oxidase [Sphingobacterium spiritivorum]
MENKNIEHLIRKYNVAAPRYTSYPTVPFWENDRFNTPEWEERVKQTYASSTGNGVSIYIHLPFCEDLCTYCGCNTRITKNHKVEDPYITAVLKEWAMYKQLLEDTAVKISEIHLGGGTPTFFQPANLERLITGILDGNTCAEDASFSFEAHPANTTESHLKTLYRLGFRRLSLGIQDFDAKVQFVINRLQTVEDVERVVAQARAIGYTSINFDLIYGLPFQTESTITETIDKALEMQPDRISFYSYAHVPWIKPGQRRFTEMDLPEGESKLRLYKLGKQMIGQEGYEDVGMDHFARPDDELFLASRAGRLHRNFMGYADRYTPLMIGLGVSSISDAWTGFAQNVKTVEEYHRLIAEGKLPVVKGHLLTGEDEILRRYILHMMCRGEMEFERGFRLNTKIKERLEPMFLDGLLTMGADNVRITETGKSFLRNICMAFDERLQQTKEQTRLFSQAI